MRGEKKGSGDIEELCVLGSVFPRRISTALNAETDEQQLEVELRTDGARNYSVQ